MPQKEWFYIDADGKEAGPVSNNQLKRLAETAVLKRQTLVWSAGMPEWTPAGRFSGFQRLFASQETVSAPQIDAPQIDAPQIAQQETFEPPTSEDEAIAFLGGDEAVAPVDPVSPIQADAEPATKTCPDCGKETPQQAAECPHCGASLLAALDDVLDEPPRIDLSRQGGSQVRRQSVTTDTTLKWILNVRKFLKSDMSTYGNDTYPAVAAGIRLISMLSKYAWMFWYGVSILVVVLGVLFAGYGLVSGLMARSDRIENNENLKLRQIAVIEEIRDETDSPALKLSLNLSLDQITHEDLIDQAVSAITRDRGAVFVPFQLEKPALAIPGILSTMFYAVFIAFAACLMGACIFIANNIQFVLSIAGCEFVVVFCDTEHHVRPNRS
ncbi:MAG: GYF domain-containing protein [Planctomycetaceae bacterium]